MYSSPYAYGAPGMGVPYGAPTSGMGAPAAYGAPGPYGAPYGAPPTATPRPTHRANTTVEPQSTATISIPARLEFERPTRFCPRP